jgi:dGTPase
LASKAVTAKQQELQKARDTRRHIQGAENESGKESRTPAQRDSDRILYCSAFRRLSGVTQVVSADEGLLIHNRLTHTIKVAQVARRIAERMRKNKTQKQIAEKIGGLDPDVVEAAALAHDLGHPPFGHIAEEELDKAVRDAEAMKDGVDRDGFEGNAQSFRIVTRQSMRSEVHLGLDLTRATLNAILKYPWHREQEDESKKAFSKWGAYRQDKDDFDFARTGFAFGDTVKSLEAEVMDWADDIAYALHDVEDFYRAGLIPLDRLISEQSERVEFYEGVWKRKGIDNDSDRSRFRDAFESVLAGKLVATGPFTGELQQRINLRRFISEKIAFYAIIIEPRLPTDDNPRLVEIPVLYERQMEMLKQITWHYVITNPALATQQHGQREVIRTLFRIYRMAASDGKRGEALFPIAFRDRLARTKKMYERDESALTRLVVDLIASMTEYQALRVFQKLTGVIPGSALDRYLHQTIG